MNTNEEMSRFHMAAVEQQTARKHRVLRLIIPLLNRARRRPLFQKVVIANIVLIAIGTSLGPVIERRYFEGGQLAPYVLFIVGGIWLSIISNYLLLKKAFRPLDDVTRTMAAIRSGNRDVRMPDIKDDPQIEQLSRSLNSMLNAMEKQRRQGAAASIKAQEEERKRIARELHDETSQSLTGLVLGISVVEELLSDLQQDEAVMKRLNGLKELANETLNEVHTLAIRLRPSMLDDLGLVAALRSYAREFTKQTSIDVELKMPRTSQRLNPDLETVIYRVIQEALTNAARHSGANYCCVTLEQEGDTICASVSDNGHGFDPRPIMMSPHGAGLGLHGMKERIELVKGSIFIDSIPDHGSTIYLKVPVGPGEGIA